MTPGPFFWQRLDIITGLIYVRGQKAREISFFNANTLDFLSENMQYSDSYIHSQDKRTDTDMYKSAISLYNPRGQRKYLNSNERDRFFECTKVLRTDKRLFCQLLYFTGARISEVYNLTTVSIDFSNKTIVFETIKRRKKGVYREIPIPSFLLEDLRIYIQNNEGNDSGCLWNFSLRTASRYVKKVMNKAEIAGIQSSAKGLRHGFAVYAISRVPITLVKKWLGHSRLETTEIYLSVTGLEEREMVKRLWSVSD
jgi:integrase/recombinase XerD